MATFTGDSCSPVCPELHGALILIVTGTETVADLIGRLGGIPADRIRLQPLPGVATEADVLHFLDATSKRLFELIDGTLVEKPMGTREALLAHFLGRRLGDFVEEHGLGLTLGVDAPFRLQLGLVRLPDLSFVSWDRIPGQEFPDDPIVTIIPDLAVEVLSVSNTEAEMELKLDHYFAAGVRHVWIIDPLNRQATIYTSRHRAKQLTEQDELTGGKVVPNFRLSLREVFDCGRRHQRKTR